MHPTTVEFMAKDHLRELRPDRRLQELCLDRAMSRDAAAMARAHRFWTVGSLVGRIALSLASIGGTASRLTSVKRITEQ